MIKQCASHRHPYKVQTCHLQVSVMFHGGGSWRWNVLRPPGAQNISRPAEEWQNSYLRALKNFPTPPGPWKCFIVSIFTEQNPYFRCSKIISRILQMKSFPSGSISGALKIKLIDHKILQSFFPGIVLLFQFTSIFHFNNIISYRPHIDKDLYNSIFV